MLIPEDVQIMLRLHRQGCGSRTIAEFLGVSRNTVKRYLRASGPLSYQTPQREKCLDSVQDWLKESFFQHKGNAAVLQQELFRVHGIKVHLRTVQKAVAPYRALLQAQRKATVRFETPPGRQLQADFGSMNIALDGVKRRIHLAVLTLGYSRRCYVQAFENEKRENWLASIEEAIFYFGGSPEEILIDNARALVLEHNLQKGVVRFNPTFADFCSFWGMTPRACAPYRPRTKGKDERTIQYVKRNAIAGREFTSISQLQTHLFWWMKEVADLRVHGTLGERPHDLFESAEKAALKPPREGMCYRIHRALRRKVHSDSCVEVETNHYSVPWQFLGKEVTVRLEADSLQIYDGGKEIACHLRSKQKYKWIVNPNHLEGLVQGREDLKFQRIDEASQNFQEDESPKSSVLLRPLAEYEAFLEEGLQ